MANLGNLFMAAKTSLLVVVAFFLFCCLYPIDAQIGVAYGNSGDNLPSPTDVISLYKSNGIGAMRMYYPDQVTLEALKGSGIKLTLGVAMDELQHLGSDASAADQWVQTNVKRFESSIDFKYIVVGNEIKPTDPQASSVLPAMQNVLNALNKNNLGYKNIKVSTSIGTELVINAYPPSNGEFKDLGYMTPIIKFLNENGSPLMASIYPYFAHKFNPQDISLEYALFTMPDEKAVVDTNNGLRYQNVFDALADATYAAIQKVVDASAKKDVDGVSEEKAGRPHHISLIASESGWSSKGGFHATRLDEELSEGGDAATVDNARTYYAKLIEHVKKGTPLKPGQPIEVFLFAMFDEDKKGGDEDEHHFGLLNPQKDAKYGSLNFN